ncbi:hypothetical protein ABEB36_011553 [Hypothenemus hampei]|uniref:Lipase domain-containing protein n=1 Tax=Hypothenemus hampei TaxID=57062 RepID=A0ABD1E875_HYPHA
MVIFEFFVSNTEFFAISLKRITCLVLLVFLSYVNTVASKEQEEEYTREKVQNVYPGFGTDYVLFPDERNHPIIGYLKLNSTSSRTFGIFDINDRNLNEDVKFEYFSREYPDGFRVTSQEILKNYVNISKPTKFITHGWMSGGRKDSSVLIRDGFLHKYDANVFVMDWSAISGNPFYPIPMMATPKVGKHYGKFLNYLVDELGVKPVDIHLVGHSLGAHVSGFAGRTVKRGKIGRITGLDPALPGFDSGLVSSGTLNSKDAHFVDVIHTCAGFLGYKSPLGHADFYPNGGCPPQPGCSVLEFMEACSHSRSWRIFFSSLVNEEPYMATKCSSLSEISTKKWCKGDPIEMGDGTPLEARGIYFTEVLEEDLLFSVEDANKV